MVKIKEPTKNELIVEVAYYSISFWIHSYDMSTLSMKMFFQSSFYEVLNLRWQLRAWSQVRASFWIVTTVDGSEILRSPVEVGNFFPLFARFYTSQVVCRISSINSIFDGWPIATCWHVILPYLGCAYREEQMSRGWPFSPLSDEQMCNKVGVVRTNQIYSFSIFLP